MKVNPDVLILDEPFSALNYQTRILVSADIYKIIKNENKSTILVAHDINVYRSYISIDNTEFDAKSISVDCSEFIEEKLTDNTLNERLRESRLKLRLFIPEVTDLCNVTKSIEDYSKLIYNFDDFWDKLSLWIKENNLTKKDAANKLGISHGLFRFWFNGGLLV